MFRGWLFYRQVDLEATLNGPPRSIRPRNPDRWRDGVCNTYRSEGARDFGGARVTTTFVNNGIRPPPIFSPIQPFWANAPDTSSTEWPTQANHGLHVRFHLTTNLPHDYIRHGDYARQRSNQRTLLPLTAGRAHSLRPFK